MTELSADLQLGRRVDAASDPEAAVLDRVPSPHGARSPAFVARFSCPEFTSRCPVTGQPDFAHIIIDYAPRQWLVESKSLKMFMVSFRDHGAFHEACSMMVAQRLETLLEPWWIRVAAYWYPRGGIPIDVFYQSGEPPSGLHIPELDIPSYRAR